MHLLRLFILIGVVVFTARGQNITVKDINQDTELARHEMQIAQIGGASISNTQRIDTIADSVSELRVEIAQAKYAVYGFGFALTALTALQVLAAFKKPKGSNDLNLKDRYR